MTEISLFILIIIFIILIIVIIHVYDRHLVKEIRLYENRLEKKGILKRHFVKKKTNKMK